MSKFITLYAWTWTLSDEREYIYIYTDFQNWINHSWLIKNLHYNDVIMNGMASQITSISTVCSTVCSGTNQRNIKAQSSTSLAFVRGIHWWLVGSRHKRHVTRKMFPFDHLIMKPSLEGGLRMDANVVCLVSGVEPLNNLLEYNVDRKLINQPLKYSAGALFNKPVPRR